MNPRDDITSLAMPVIAASMDAAVLPRSVRRFRSGADSPWRMALVVCLFIIIQHALTVHDVRHLTSDHGAHNCEFCLLGGGLDQAGPPAMPVVSFKPFSPPVFAVAKTASFSSPFLAYQGRAPPFDPKNQSG